MTRPVLTLAALNDETAEDLNDLEIAKINGDLDVILLANDKRSESKHLIARLLTLNSIERAREIRLVAKELNVPIAAVKEALREATAETSSKGQGRPLELPEIEPWPDLVDGAKLLDELCRAIAAYLVLPTGSVEILALWGVHTHVFRSLRLPVSPGCWLRSEFHRVRGGMEPKRSKAILWRTSKRRSPDTLRIRASRRHNPITARFVTLFKPSR